MSYLDETAKRALRQETGKLAAELNANGSARLVPARRTLRFLRNLSESLARSEARSPSDLLRHFAEGARTIEVCARRAELDAGARLPACGGVPRILLAARALCGRGERPLSADDLAETVAAFEEAQNLTMAEEWSIPEALRIAACEAYAEQARAALIMAQNRACAEKWFVTGASPRNFSTCPVEFFERALQLAAEEERPDVRELLERALSQTDRTPEVCVELTHRHEALLRLRADRLLGLCRALDGADWPSLFERFSRAERALREDPSGIYPAMAEESRRAVREELSRLARRLRMGEAALAKRAVDLAGEGKGGVCYFLYDDDGRRALVQSLNRKSRAPKLHPDPGGRRFALAVPALSLAASVLLAKLCGSLLWTPALLPPVWNLILFAFGQIVPLFVKPRAVLRMDWKTLPDSARTAVVIPALLTSPQRAEELCDQLETLGCLENDPNLEFVLLGDLKDAKTADDSGDADILRAARERIAALNRKAGREKYHFLYRVRSFASRDGVWRGRARKRGALMAFARLSCGGENEFAEGGEALRGVRYAVTLDADTRMLPGSAQRLVSALRHPLNAVRTENGRRKGFAVLQPMVELDASECRSRFVRLFAGAGGMSAYSGMVSNLYHDLTGAGSYCGKAAIDLRSFLAALDGALDEERVLSHDLIEGILAGAGAANDCALLDGFPASYPKYLSRLSRWCRGDWQLLPELFRPNLSLFDRFRMASNLVESLREAMLLMLLLFGVWLDEPAAFSLGVALIFLAPLVSYLRGDRDALLRACAELAALPATAYARLDAAVRALYRTFVSHKKLLDWVTSSDARGSEKALSTPCRAAALLLIPGLFRVEWILPSLALGGLFLLSPAWLNRLAVEPVSPRKPLTEEQKGALTALARDTWRFFERYVNASGNYLPPDNVQIDPDRGAAMRTSPTNVAMYLTSCLSAYRLGFLNECGLETRLTQTLRTLERLEKWHGHLYNWYATDQAAPMRPRYVSAVDSGNLAAALLLCAAASDDPGIAERMERLAREMDFSCLYDPKARLFHIGADAEHNRLSASHYDLMASEARILSYVALMLGQVPIEHWRALGRPVSQGALLSWSGTMFEYLMPELFLKSEPDTLLGRTADRAVALQMRYGRECGRPWGVSESGYHAFDLHLNYQYRAFGLRDLCMSGASSQEVVAPYAACLALSRSPREAAENLSRMKDLGWAGECGLYEAADYTRREPRLVKSWMSHHQGMALTALCNALTEQSLRDDFMRIPQARALRPLLNERAAVRVRLGRTHTPNRARPLRPVSDGARLGRSQNRLADTCLLGGGETMALATARGDVVYARNGVFAHRFTGDLLRRRDSLVTCLIDRETGAERRLNAAESRCVFSAGCAAYSGRLDGVAWELKICVSPEDGALAKRIELKNESGRPARLRLVDFFETALMDEGELRAHPAFFRLFCVTDFSNENAVVTRRTPRSPGETHPVLFHKAAGGTCLRQSDWSCLRGRDGAMKPFAEGVPGAQTEPCSALAMDLELDVGETRQVSFAVGLTEEEHLEASLARWNDPAASERARFLAADCARSAMRFAGLSEEQRNLAERGAAFLLDPRLASGKTDAPAPVPEGLPTAAPILSVLMEDENGLCALREAARMHEYCRARGFRFTLAAVNDYGSDYRQPLRDGAEELIASTGLRDLRGVPGGVCLLEGASREGARAVSALFFDGKTDFWTQLRQTLQALELPRREAPKPLPDRSAPAEAPVRGHWEGGEYVFRIGPGALCPAPWSNILTTDSGMGMLVTERGGGFLWHANSRLMRVTAFDNDPACEGWGMMLYVAQADGGYFRALPGRNPDRVWEVRHGLSQIVFAARAGDYAVETRIFAQDEKLCFALRLENRGETEQAVDVIPFVDFLMGADASDAACTRTFGGEGALFAAGAMPGAAYLVCADAPARPCGERNAFLGHGGTDCPDGLFVDSDKRGGCALRVSLRLAPGEGRTVSFVLGWAENWSDARERAGYTRRSWNTTRMLKKAERDWEDRAEKLRIATGDAALDRLFNGFLLKQVLDGRLRARAGFYQAGGAYGFRDQLQDLLSLLPLEPERARAHILCCAEHQFASGDVMHWWHPPVTGVRTRVSDDLLFLPLVTARYVRCTGDADILEENLPYLRDEIIPEGTDDWYGTGQFSGEMGNIREHCLRALRRAYCTGEHGLLLMGSGDWNDGMNRVGAAEKGESVWLSMFYAVCAREFAEYADETEKNRLLETAREQLARVEEHAWEADRYLRAFHDDGKPLGSQQNAECRIDLLCQAWAALAGLDPQRAETAMQTAWRELYDPDRRLLRLLTPPFTGRESDPGYLAAYPAGVRENGGQYTHAACWYLLALAKQGDAARAKELLRALLPETHAQDEAYRAEPYVLAADVYAEGRFAGRGGWTWYTGAAGWLRCAVLALIGFQKEGDRARLNALRGVWDRPELTLRVGSATYRLVSAPDATETTLDDVPQSGSWVSLIDDGQPHTAVFPQREGETDF